MSNGQSTCNNTGLLYALQQSSCGVALTLSVMLLLALSHNLTGPFKSKQAKPFQANMQAGKQAGKQASIRMPEL